MTNLHKPSPIKDFAEGFSLPARSYKILFSHPGIKSVAVIPFIINVILFFGLIAIVFYMLTQWEIPDFENWTFWGGSYLSAGINSLIDFSKYLLLIPLALVVAYYSFSSVGMIVASPFNDILSERIERALCEEKSNVSLPLHLNAKSTMLSLIDTIKIALKQLVCTLLALPFLLIPIVGFIPFFLVTAWFSGRGYADVGMARNYLRERHKAPAIRANKWKIFGMGVAMELLLMIPFLNLFLLPFGVCAGTFLYCQINWETLLKENNLDKPKGFKAPKPISVSVS